jgi:hypothetical protein
MCENGELDILNSDSSINKKVKCKNCGFTNLHSSEKKEPEVVIIRRRTQG